MVRTGCIATLHLFAGGGGGILADRLLGRDIVGAVEIEKYPREILLSRQADGILPLFPGSEASEDISASQEDSPARISPLRGKEPDWKERAQGYGARCGGLLARWNPDSSSWRTAQCLLFEDSTECLETLPKWGSLADGELSELTILEHPTEGRGSGSGENRRKRHIPTPTVTDAGGYGSGRRITTEDNFRGVSLKWLVEQRPDKFWPD